MEPLGKMGICVKPIAYTRALACAASVLAVTPADARFLQRDPVGYADQINLYAYVGNDPLNQVDPSGTDAIVLVYPDGSRNIILPMTFTGDAATPRNVATAIGNIQKSWTGTFDGIKVTTTVVQGASSLAPNVKNTMAITSGNTSRVDATNGSQGHSFVRGGNTGEVTMKDVKGTPITQPNGTQTVADKGVTTFGHEAGHYMGAPDRGGSGMMAPGSSTRPSAQDVNAITQTRTQTGAINTVIKRQGDNKC